MINGSLEANNIPDTRIVVPRWLYNEIIEQYGQEYANKICVVSDYIEIQDKK